MSFKRLVYFFMPALLLTVGLLVSTGHQSVNSTESKAVSAADRPLNSLRDLNQAFIEIADAATPSVVTVFTEKVIDANRSRNGADPFDGIFGQFFGQRYQQQYPNQDMRQRGLGSGIIMTDDGYILTNNHVVDDVDSIMVRVSDGKNYHAKLIGTDPKTDVAVIKIEASGLTPIRKGDSDKLKVGEMVIAIGSPLSGNLAHTVTSGIVSATGRNNVGLADYEDFIQTDAAINPGNSGGALVNLDGELVGINSAIATRSGGFEGIGFAVPINMASHVMQSLIDNGKVVRGWLGVSIQNISDDVAKAMDLASTEGALVSDVLKDGPAEKAGMKPEDVVVAVNGDAIKSSSQLRNQIASTSPGTKVNLTVLRDKDKVSIPITLGELPSDDQLAQASGQTPQLGFRVAPIDPELAARYNVEPDVDGVIVIDVDANSEAYEGGLRNGDVIRSVNRQAVSNLSDFNSVARDIHSGDTVLLRIVRQNSGYFIAFTI